jgi:S-adenosyl-methyltransferase MraW
MKDFSSPKNLSHYPVMLNEVLKICNPASGGNFIDCTFGYGGYSNALLSFPKTKVIAFDRDYQTKKYAEKTKQNFKSRFSFHNKKFSELSKIINDKTKFDVIIFDLGLSSMQIFDLDRGFSFNSKSSMDMRMGLNSISAQEVVNSFSQSTLNEIFKFFGEEKESFKISKNIINDRKKSPILTNFELAKIIKKSKKKNFNKKINVSTKVFQALRIFVNKEFSELINGLIEATKLIKSGGKIIVISFHSLEDRIVKFFFTNYSKNKSKTSRYVPELSKEKTLLKIIGIR